MLPLKTSASELESILRRVPAFSAASDDDLRAIARLGIERAVEEAGYFFSQGAPADHLYILLSGRVKLCQVALDGQQVNVRTVAAGQLFGAIGAVEPEASYPAAAQALEDSTALAIPRGAFRELLEERPHLSFGLMRLMTGYIQEMQERYRELATERVERRIALTVLRLAAQIGVRAAGNETMVELPLARQDVAEASGTTIFTVSRVLADWERRGLVETGRERVLIRSPHGLVQIAEGLEQ